MVREQWLRYAGRGLWSALKPATKEDPMAKSKTKKHGADVADATVIANAVEFTAYLRISPTKKIVDRFKTLAGAAARAVEIREQNRGRDALVYAIDAAGKQSPVDKEAQAAAIAAGEDFQPPAFLQKGATAETDPPPAKARPVAAPAPRSAMAEKPAKGGGKRAAIEGAAREGKMPAAPDFSAATHARFRKKLGEVIELAEKGDLKGLKAIQINPVSSSPKAIERYRNLCVMALEAMSA